MEIKMKKGEKMTSKELEIKEKALAWRVEEVIKESERFKKALTKAIMESTNDLMDGDMVKAGIKLGMAREYCGERMHDDPDENLSLAVADMQVRAENADKRLEEIRAICQKAIRSKGKSNLSVAREINAILCRGEGDE